MFVCWKEKKQNCLHLDVFVKWFLTKDTEACQEIDYQQTMGSYLDVSTNYYVSAKCLSVEKTLTLVNQLLVNKMQQSYVDVLVNCFLTKGMEACQAMERKQM